MWIECFMVMGIIFKYRNSHTEIHPCTTVPSHNKYTSLGKVSGKSYVTELTVWRVSSVIPCRSEPWHRWCRFFLHIADTKHIRSNWTENVYFDMTEKTGKDRRHFSSFNISLLTPVGRKRKRREKVTLASHMVVCAVMLKQLAFDSHCCSGQGANHLWFSLLWVWCM